MDKIKALRVIEQAIEEIDTMMACDAESDRFERWQAHAAEALIALRGEDSLDVTRFRHIVYQPGTMADSKAAIERLWRAGKGLASQILCNVVLEVERSTRVTPWTSNEVPTEVSTSVR